MCSRVYPGLYIQCVHMFGESSVDTFVDMYVDALVDTFAGIVLIYKRVLRRCKLISRHASSLKTL